MNTVAGERRYRAFLVGTVAGDAVGLAGRCGAILSRFACEGGAMLNLHLQSSQHAFPLIPSIPSLPMIGTITSPATGSAHH